MSGIFHFKLPVYASLFFIGICSPCTRFIFQLIVSNDSDLAESLRLVKAQNQKVIGLVTPGAPQRKTSRQLSRHADFVKPIRTWMLQSSQLPNPIPGTTIHKPAGW